MSNTMRSRNRNRNNTKKQKRNRCRLKSKHKPKSHTISSYQALSELSNKHSQIDHQYVDRINTLLKIYSDFIKSQGTGCKCIYSIICDYYSSKDAIMFCQDYYEYIMNIDNHRLNHDLCDFATCSSIQRQYRHQNMNITTTDQPVEIYNDQIDTKDIAISQLLDILHVSKYHLQDLGLRYENAVNSHNINPKQFLQEMTKKLQVKKNVYNEIKKSSNTTSKFVTEAEKSNQDELTNEKTYEFGYRWYYHQFYKDHGNCVAERIPGLFLHALKSRFRPDAELPRDVATTRYTYGSSYIVPKYTNIKEDALFGKPQKLSIVQYKASLQKAVMKYKAYRLNRAKGIFQEVYKIKPGTPITLNHILSVLFYTNFTTLSTAFSRTYRKINSSEDIDDVKKRHKEYGNWGRFLRETVEVWGRFFEEVPEHVNHFYHGISSKLALQGVSQRFCAPTSTTLEYSTAVMFANQGIVLTIAKDRSLNMHFNCIPWSDYPGEMEMLFVGGWLPLKVCGLTDIAMEINLDQWIHSILLFQIAMINGEQLEHKILRNYQICIDKLITNYLHRYTKQNTNSDIPLYVEQLFENVLESAHTIHLNIELFNIENMNGEDVDVVFFGCKSLSHIYFEKNGDIKWNALPKLFPRLKCIQIAKYHPNNFERITSIEIDHKFIQQMMSLFQQSNIVYVQVDIPSNSIRPITKLMSKYRSTLLQQDLNCYMDKVPDPICDFGCQMDVLTVQSVYCSECQSTYGSNHV